MTCWIGEEQDRLQQPACGERRAPGSNRFWLNSWGHDPALQPSPMARRGRIPGFGALLGPGCLPPGREGVQRTLLVQEQGAPKGRCPQRLSAQTRGVGPGEGEGLAWGGKGGAASPACRSKGAVQQCPLILGTQSPPLLSRGSYWGITISPGRLGGCTPGSSCQPCPLAMCPLCHAPPHILCNPSSHLPFHHAAP